MIFNDFVIGLNEQMDNLRKLNDIIKELENILSAQKRWTSNTFRSIYSRTISTSYNTHGQNNANELIRSTDNHYNNLREHLIAIDFLEFGEILSDFKSTGLKCIEEETDNIIAEFKNTYKTIHEYRKFTDAEDRMNGYIECVEAIKNMNSIFQRFKYLVNYINKINTQLNGTCSEDGLNIRLLNEGIEKDTYVNVVNPMYIIYEKLCEIANIDSNTEKLEIARIETGSFFVKFLGNKSILKVIGKILETSHNIIVRNFTRDGQRKNLVESTELFRAHFDLVKEMKELGLGVNEHEEIAKETLVLIMKQSNILLSSSPDVRINNKVLSKSNDMKKVLEKRVYNMLLEKESKEEII
ncbi:hypothetical protein [Clostridium paraputrificum]|uniref:hypothetical protein n=2 Tax=Clostridium paraputrificum TaxID=29363 RepID=UPI00247FBBA3|nr:hypothetical protein [Clostridium paraputrificum]MDB2086627.1 hypothetical protein [Clostridium paraputrificum]